MASGALVPYWCHRFSFMHTVFILSFAQMALPAKYLSVETKGILWVILFGMAKTCQYGGLTILGVEGYKRVKAWLKVNKEKQVDKDNSNSDN